MVHFTKRNLHDDAVYWEFVRTDRYGETVTLAPVEISCRWIDGEADLRDAMGNTVTVEAIIVTAIDLKINSIVRHSTLADFTGTGTTLEDDKICQIKVVGKAPSLNYRNYYRSYGLVKYGGKRPVPNDE